MKLTPENERLEIVKRFNITIGPKATEKYFQEYSAEFGCKPVDILEGPDYTRLYKTLNWLESIKIR